jgi:hypothetical protein
MLWMRLSLVKDDILAGGQLAAQFARVYIATGAPSDVALFSHTADHRVKYFATANSPMITGVLIGCGFEPCGQPPSEGLVMLVGNTREAEQLLSGSAT